MSSASHGDAEPQQAVLVLGMHRSGTSALTRLLNFCGAALPATLLPADEAVNRAGFWESQRLVALNNEILAASGRSWDDLRPMPEGWSEGAAAAFLERIAVALREEFGPAPLIVLKDPRLSLLMPLYRQALDRLGIQPFAVIPIRHPLEVAASLGKRDGLGEGKALLLWLAGNLAAERESRDMPRCFVAYEALLGGGASEMSRMGVQLGIAWPHAPATVADEMRAFLAPELRHHKRDAAEFLADPAMPDDIKAVYGWLLAAAAGTAPSPERLDIVQSVLDQAGRLYDPAIAALEAQAAQCAAERDKWIAVAVQRYEVIEDLRREIERLQTNLP